MALDTYLGYNIIEINRGICNKSHLIQNLWIFSYFVLSSIVSCIFRFYLALCSNMCSSSTFDVYSKYEQCQQKNEKCHYNAMSQKFYFSKYSLVILFMNFNRNPSLLGGNLWSKRVLGHFGLLCNVSLLFFNSDSIKYNFFPNKKDPSTYFRYSLLRHHNCKHHTTMGYCKTF